MTVLEMGYTFQVPIKNKPKKCLKTFLDFLANTNPQSRNSKYNYVVLRGFSVPAGFEVLWTCLNLLLGTLHLAPNNLSV